MRMLQSVVSVNSDFAFVWDIDARQHLYQRALARAILTDDAVNGPRPDRDRLTLFRATTPGNVLTTP